MRKNYYEILEVSQNASSEVIEKAYKTLAKKYHPDLQPDEASKKESENKMKEINEAYEVLSDENKRKTYNLELEEEKRAQIEKTQNSTSQNNSSNFSSSNKPNQSANSAYYNAQSNANNISAEQERLRQEAIRQQQLEYELQMQQARQKAYYDAYIQDLKNRGYKIRYKKTFKDYVKSGIALLLTIFVLFLIVQIPFVKQFFVNMYYENEALRAMVDAIMNLFK